MERILNTALEKDREVRYQCAAELRAELKRLKRDTSSGKVTSARSIGIPEPPHKKRSSRTAIAVAAAVLIIAALAWLAIRQRRPGSPALPSSPTPVLDSRVW